LNKSDRALLKKINRDLERRSHMRKIKEEGEQSASQKSERKPAKKITRHIKSRIKLLPKQDAKLMLNYLEYWGDDPTTDMFDFLWRFIVYLRQKKIHLIDNETVFCVPFSHLADKSKLIIS